MELKATSRISLWGTIPVWHVVVPTVTVVALAIGAAAFYLPNSMRSSVIEAAHRGNLEVADLIKLTRGYYTRHVVAKAMETGGLNPSYDHAKQAKGIPLPATFVKDVSDLLQKKETSLSLISPYPWPHRAARKMDEFQAMAWRAFQQNPDAVVSRVEAEDGQRVLRVAVADRMTGKACITCHNEHAESQKRDWKIGDVRAVMEVKKLIEPDLAAAERRSRTIVGSLGAIALAAMVVLLLIARLVVRRAREKQAADRHVHFLAHHDALTGVLNRASFGRMFASLLRREQDGETRVAVHYIDIDNFKDVNDKFGHGTGDQLVRAVAARLRRAAGPREVLARLGGDEFVLAQLDVTSPTQAATRAAAIVRDMAEPLRLEHTSLRISVSVGSAVSTGPGQGAEELLRGADLALYRAKREGRNRFLLFRPEMLEELEARRRLEQTLRKASEEGGFELHYQPVWDVASRSLCGFEALLRLRDDNGVPIPPAVFIPVAEETGLIGAIGAWVVNEACRVASTWPEHLKIAVNLSPAQFVAGAAGPGRISDVVRDALTHTGLAPDRLELEVTENLLLENNEPVLDELARLNRTGVSLVMDDFGTGYSSLNYLWKFPFRKLKIDRAFVRAASRENHTVTAIVRTINALARTLDMRVTVEGVETSEQVALFAQLGCDQLQGFYLGRPVPAAEVAPAILNDFCRRGAHGAAGTGPIARSA